MGMMEFGLAMLAANLAFVPAATYRQLFRSFASPSPTPGSSTGFA